MRGSYKIIIGEHTKTQVEKYKALLMTQSISSGVEFTQALGNRDISELTSDEFTEVLLSTKKPKCFAESEIFNGNWNMIEYSILAELGTIVKKVEIYDNGHWEDPTPYNAIKSGNLLFTAGALLKGPTTSAPGSDHSKIIKSGQIDSAEYFNFYENRLLPLLLEANTYSSTLDKKAFITFPGLGCGEFAGGYKAEVQQLFPDTLKAILQKYNERLPYIAVIRLDLGPFSQIDMKEKIGQIDFIFKSQGVDNEPQLSMPEQFGKNYNGYEFFKVVAGDPVSFPGNDSYIDVRWTDEGVIGHATNLMSVITGIKGQYINGKYHRSDKRTWESTRKELQFI